MKNKREKNSIFIKTSNAIPDLDDARPSATRRAIGVAYILLYTFQDYIKPMLNHFLLNGIASLAGIISENKAGGNGTAVFVSKAIEKYCQ